MMIRTTILSLCNNDPLEYEKYAELELDQIELAIMIGNAKTIRDADDYNAKHGK